MGVRGLTDSRDNSIWNNHARLVFSPVDRNIHGSQQIRFGMVVCISKCSMDFNANMTALLFVDGNCRFCTTFTFKVANRVGPSRLRIGALQSAAGAHLTRRLTVECGLHEDTMVLVTDGKYYIKSDAAIRVLLMQGGIWRVTKTLLLVPRVIRNYLYDRFGRVRYRWFGRLSVCQLFDHIQIYELNACLSSPLTD